jgi:hypothetical protein
LARFGKAAKEQTSTGALSKWSGRIAAKAKKPVRPGCSGRTQRGLTPRSTGPATASAVSLARGTWCIIASQAYGACLRRPVSSNVRRHIHHNMSLSFDKTIKAGDLLTSVTVVVSVLTLVNSLSRDRLARETEQASKIRATASAAIVRLDRWQALQMARYADLHTTAIELSELFMAKRDVVATRDALWKKVVEARSRTARQILDEQLGTGYSDLITYFPAARPKYSAAYEELSAVEEQNTAELLADAEKAVLDLRKSQTEFQTADLGNAIRGAASVHEKNLKVRSDKVLEPVRSYLLGVISSDNDQLLSFARK